MYLREFKINPIKAAGKQIQSLMTVGVLFACYPFMPEYDEQLVSVTSRLRGIVVYI